MATQAALTFQSVDMAATLETLLATDGTASHAYPPSPELLYGRHATRNLADAAYYLCMLHGRHPGVVDFAAMRETDPGARAWLANAAEGFTLERLFLTESAWLPARCRARPAMPNAKQRRSASAMRWKRSLSPNAPVAHWVRRSRW